jgi:hypothetical protein
MKFFFLISTCIALGAAIVFEGDFVHQVLLIVAMIYVIFPTSLIMGICTAVAACRQSLRPWYFMFWRVAGILTFSVFLSWVAGYGLHEWRLRQTRDYVLRALAVLDDYYARTGQYSNTLPIDVLGSPPKWLRNSKFCNLGVQDFRFEYSDPAAMMNLNEFTSAKRTWISFW